MNHGSLFSGIGGFDLASEWMGWDNVFQVEWDSYCQKVLAKNFPNVKRYGDIKEFDGTKYRGLIDIISGGFPCQPFSVAGKQKGESDDRHLWPEMLRVIRDIQPAWVVGENVPGIIAMELENICIALESENYQVQPFIIPSASIGAWDKRDRIWIIAHNNAKRNGQKYGLQTRGTVFKRSDIESNTDTIGSRRENGLHGRESERETRKRSNYFKESDWWKRDWIEVASELCRSNARVPNRMDRIKGLGNSVNPYVPFQIFKAIQQMNS
jgi:DNA (cytosine-5)-methyltransferase 1